MADDKEQVYGRVVLGTSPLRKETEVAIYVAWFARSPDSSGRRKEQVKEFANAVSDVWKPVVERLLDIVADAYADVDGWKQRASDVVFDQTLNPVVAVYDTEKHEFVDGE